MQTKEPKPKSCKVCKAKFTPRASTQVVCSWQCSIAHTAKEKAKRERKDYREKKEALKSLSEWKKDVQMWCNKYIRMRDDKEPCISCGRHHQGQYHAGHYLSVGSHPELRWDERNIYKQCAPCNNHLSGNLINYRKRLIELKGKELVDWLEGPHEPLKPNIDYCKKQIEYFKNKIKQLK